MFQCCHCSTSFSCRLTLLVFVFVAGSIQSNTLLGPDASTASCFGKVYELWFLGHGVASEKYQGDFFSIQKIQQTIENQKQRAAAQASLLRKHDISIKNIPSMCVTVAPGLQSPVAVLVPKRLGSWFRQLRSTSAKKWRWNHRKHIREVRQTATYRTNRCIIFYITYYIIQMYTVYTYTLVDRHVLPDTQDIRHHPTEVTLPAAEPKQPRYVVFAGIPKS